MTMHKKEVLELVRQLPEEVDIGGLELKAFGRVKHADVPQGGQVP